MDRPHGPPNSATYHPQRAAPIEWLAGFNLRQGRPKGPMPRPSSSSSPQIDISIGKLVAGVLGLLLIWGLVSSIYSVPVDSVAIVTRFGKHVREADRGFNFKLPLGIEEAIVVPTRRQMKMEFGFGTERSTNRYQVSDVREQQVEQNMVTGDLNAVLVQWVVQYNIRDAVHYLFNVNQPEETLRAASEAVMRSVIGDRTVDEVITVGKDAESNERRWRTCGQSPMLMRWGLRSTWSSSVT